MTPGADSHTRHGQLLFRPATDCVSPTVRRREHELRKGSCSFRRRCKGQTILAASGDSGSEDCYVPSANKTRASRSTIRLPPGGHRRRWNHPLRQRDSDGMERL